MSGIFDDNPAARKMLMKAQSGRRNDDHRNDGHKNDDRRNDSGGKLMEALKDMVRPIVWNMQWVFDEYTPEEQEVVLYIISLFCDDQRRRLMRESVDGVRGKRSEHACAAP